LVDEDNLNRSLERWSQTVEVGVGVLGDGSAPNDGSRALAAVVAASLESETSTVVLDELAKDGYASLEGYDERD
jgi:hypothetical protein